MKRRLFRVRQLALAGWRAFRYRRRIGAPIWRDGWGLVRAILRRRRRIPLGLWKRRLRACQACDLYDRDRKTCGDNQSILQLPDRLAPSGCSCLVGIKASESDSDCYLVSIGGPSQWPKR